MEIWKDIVSYDGLYQVSNLGRVKSLKRNRETIFKLLINRDGYPVCQLFYNKKHISYKIHRLVALSFIPNPENKTTVNHINGVKTDNRVENLEWNTRSENILHAFQIGLKKSSKGISNGRSKLTEKEVLKIRLLLSKGMKQNDISKKFNISTQTISSINKRLIWKHIK
jgi:NUMOD4 motif/HNH endonuclease